MKASIRHTLSTRRPRQRLVASWGYDYMPQRTRPAILDYVRGRTPRRKKKRPGFPGRLLTHSQSVLGRRLLRGLRNLRNCLLQLRRALRGLALRAKLLALVTGSLGSAHLLSGRSGSMLVKLGLERCTVRRTLRSSGVLRNRAANGERGARDQNMTNLHANSASTSFSPDLAVS